MKIAFLLNIAALAVLVMLVNPAFGQPVSKDAYDCPEFLIPRKDKQTNLYGYVDIGGNYVIPPTFLQAGYFQGKNARVQVGKRFGVINCQGHLVVPATFEVIDDFVNGYGWVRQNGKWGLMRSDGRLEVPPAFDSVETVARRSSMTWVYKDSLWGIFDKDSRKMIIKPAYKMYRNVSDSLVIGRYDAWFDIVDLKKQLAVVDSATEIARLTPKVLAYKKRRWGLIDIRGRLLDGPHSDTTLADTSFIIGWQNSRPSLYTANGRPVPVKLTVDSLALTGGPLVRYRSKTGQGLLNAAGRKVFVNEYDKVIGPLGRFALLNREGWFLYRQGSKAVGPEKYDSVKVLNHRRHFALYSQGSATVYSARTGQIVKPGILSFVAGDTGTVIRTLFVQGGNQGLLNLKTGSTFNPNKKVEFAPPQAPLFAYSFGGKQGVVNYNTLKTVTEPEFEQVQFFHFQGRPAFAAIKGGDLVVRDASNRALVQKEIRNGQLPVIAFNNSGIFFKRKGEFGGVALNGEEVVKPTYDTVLVPQENNPQVFLGRKGEEWSLVKSDGAKVVGDVRKAQFLGFSLWAGSLKGVNKVFDYNGAEKKAPTFDSIMAFTENLAAIKVGSSWGFVDRQFNSRIQPKYESATPFFRGKSVVKLNGLFGLIDQNGQFLLKPKYSGYVIKNGQYNLF